MTTADVAIVGAGPVGLVTALLIAEQGVSVTVLEAEAAVGGTDWRGSTVHPPTLELLDRLGLATPMIDDGVRVDVVQYRDIELSQVASFDYSLLTGLTRFPFRLQYEQYKLLRQLRRRAVEHPGIDLRLGTAVTSLALHDEHVNLTVDAASTGRSRLRARWVIGADGSHSIVRKTLGIGFPGEATLPASVVIATPVDFFVVIEGLSPVSYWTGPRGRSSLIRTPDVWRVALTADDVLLAEARSGAHDPSRGPDAEIVERLATFTGGQPLRLRQYQPYRSHHRVAVRFRAGRVLLAGDAAHITSTTGGMGLNSGIHDAFELAAQLLPVLVDGADDRRLDKYDARRRRVALNVTVPLARSTSAAVDERALTARRDRLESLCRIVGDPDQATHHLCRVSMMPPPAGPSRTSGN